MKMLWEFTEMRIQNLEIEQETANDPFHGEFRQNTCGEIRAPARTLSQIPFVDKALCRRTSQ